MPIFSDCFLKFLTFSTESLLTRVFGQMIMKVRGKISATGNGRENLKDKLVRKVGKER